MQRQGFSAKGNWYKGNLHSHTVNSDGSLTPGEAAAFFQEHGYHFLCFSEHDLFTDYSARFNSERFLILPGLEASAMLVAADGKHSIKLHHMHGILGTSQMQQEASDVLYEHMEPVPPRIFVGDWDGAQVAQELCDTLRSHGCFVTYNHPIWSRVQAEEFIHTEGLWGLEIFNYNTVNESGTGYDVTHWDTMLRQGRRIWGFASDDNHNGGGFPDACGGWVCVKAEALTHDAIVGSLLSGNFYASSGPEIHDWGIHDGVAYVQCSPVSRVNFMVGNLVNAGVTVLSDSMDDTLTQAEFRLQGEERYLRVECIDRFGRTAWTNPLFF